MEDKVIVLSRDGEWLELVNCFLVGAVEHSDKIIYYKYLFTKSSKETSDEMLKRAEQYLTELKAQK